MNPNGAPNRLSLGARWRSARAGLEILGHDMVAKREAKKQVTLAGFARYLQLDATRRLVGRC